MKKTYKTPKYKTIDLSGENMIAGSIDGLSTDMNEEVVTTTDYAKGASHMNLWDEEW